ncbi:MAG: 30S ribosomal protein S20 [candidate division WOR-3 bacterium]|nr:MAG: 30S ribosomal protein S20 [candidate division WOR-3 bacterium]
MPGKSLSVVKRVRQNEKRRLRNRKRRQELKDMLKTIRAESSKEAAQKLLPKAQSIIDRSERHHVIHRNAARRLKSRLAKEVAEKQ